MFSQIYENYKTFNAFIGSIINNMHHFFIIKQSMCINETISVALSDDFILKIKQILYEALKELMISNSFTNKYGRDIVNFNILIDHYIIILRNTTFMNTFLKSVLLKELLNEVKDASIFLMK